MTRRGLMIPALGALAAACSPLAALNALAPRDRSARRVARGLTYGEEPRQAFDVYAPTGEAPEDGWPTLVFFYGGGWNSGSREHYGWAGQALAAQGFVVAVPDYRLSPEVHFPVFIEDAAAATAAVAQVAATYGGDPERLGVMGHSAGAHLALMITLDARYMAAAGRLGVIKAAAGLAGPYEFLPFDVASSRDAFGRAPDPRQTQPITFARGDAPPIWLGHGTEDETVHAEDSVLLDAAIRRAGGDVELKLYDGLNHADLVATLAPLFRRKAPVLSDVAGFLHRALG